MNYLRIAGGVLIILLVAVGWGQYRQIGLQRELIEKQEVAIDTAIQNTEKVLGIVEKNDVLMTDLLMAQGQVNSSLIARQQEIRRLQNDIEEVREWANQSLPANPRTNGDLNLTLEQTEADWAVCAAQVDMIFVCQNKAKTDAQASSSP